jgi:hypothetical protein
MTAALGLILVTLAGGSHATARPTAQRYLKAIADGDAAEICHLLSPSARREMREEEFGHSCRWSARQFPRELGRYPIVKIEFPSRDRADVTIGDHEISDSGDDVFGMSHASGRWLVTTP